MCLLASTALTSSPMRRRLSSGCVFQEETASITIIDLADWSTAELVRRTYGRERVSLSAAPLGRHTHRQTDRRRPKGISAVRRVLPCLDACAFVGFPMNVSFFLFCGEKPGVHAIFVRLFPQISCSIALFYRCSVVSSSRRT